MSHATTILTQHALDYLGGELHDTALHLTDSFGTLTFTPHPRGLLDHSGTLITSRADLTRRCQRAGPINAAGLTHGTLLTRLGPATFHLSEIHERLSGRTLRLSLRRTTPTRFGGVTYDEWNTTIYRNGPHFSSGTTTVNRHGGWLIEIPDGIRQAIWDAVWGATVQIVTPTAAHAAGTEMYRTAIDKAAQAVRDAQHQLVQAELALTSHLYAPYPLPKGA